MTDPRAFLTAQGVVDDSDFDMRGVAYALAALHGAPPDSGRLDRLAEQVRGLLPDGADSRRAAAALAEILCRRHPFQIDEDGDGEITHVTDLRRGPEESLAPLWLLIAACAGLDCDVPAFPLRQLLRVNDDQGGRVIIDCRDGACVDAADLRRDRKQQCGRNAELDAAFFLPRTPRDVILTWRQTLKTRALRLGRMADALAYAESALLFAPTCTTLWRETGIMRLRMNDMAGAAAALEQFVQRVEYGAAQMRARQLLAEIRAQMT